MGKVIDRARMFLVKQRIEELKKALARSESQERRLELEELEEELLELEMSSK